MLIRVYTRISMKIFKQQQNDDQQFQRVHNQNVRIYIDYIHMLSEKYL